MSDFSVYVRRRPDGQYEQVSLDAVRRENPNIAFSEKPSAKLLSKLNLHQVPVSDSPAIDSEVEELDFALVEVGGRLSQRWEKRLKPAPEVRDIALKRAQGDCETALQVGAPVEVEGRPYHIVCSSDVIQCLLVLQQLPVTEVSVSVIPARDEGGQFTLIPASADVIQAALRFVLGAYQALWQSQLAIHTADSAETLQRLGVARRQ